MLAEPFGALDEEVQRLYLQTNKTVIFVTHAIDESILLADEVVVMTARPGRVKAVIPIGLARPRTLEHVNSPAFGALFDEIYHLIKGTSKNDAAGVNPDVPCGLPDSGQV